MKLMMKKQIIFLALLCMSLSVLACGNNSDSASSGSSKTTETTADEDGNVEVLVNISNGTLHGNMSKKWKKEEIGNKEKKSIAKAEEIFNTTNLEVNSSLFECIYGDIDSDLSVWSLMSEKDNEILNYHGIIIRSNGEDYTFPDIYHGKNPSADYNENTHTVFLAGGTVEGTNTHAEALYAFDVKDDGVTYVTMLDPYEVQEYIVEKVTYDVNVNDITFKFNKKVLAEMTNHEDGAGALRAIAVGEQMYYEFDENHNANVFVTPGLKFGAGTNLYYGDSPVLKIDVSLNDDKFVLGDIKSDE